VRAQAGVRWQMVLVDDASTDGCFDPVRQLEDQRIRILVNDSNLGVTRSLIRGCAAASTEFIARVDADDLMFPDRLRKQLDFLKAHPDHVLVGTQCLRIDGDGQALAEQTLFPVSDAGLRWQGLVSMPVAGPALCFRRTAYEAAGGFDAAVPITEDFDLLRRLAAQGLIANLDERLTGYRVQGSGYTGQRYQEMLAVADQVAQAFQQQQLGSSIGLEATANLRAFLHGGRDQPCDTAQALADLRRLTAAVASQAPTLCPDPAALLRAAVDGLRRRGAGRVTALRRCWRWWLSRPWLLRSLGGAPPLG
jgi:hypothetical protein